MTADCWGFLLTEYYRFVEHLVKWAGRPSGAQLFVSSVSILDGVLIGLYVLYQSWRLIHGIDADFVRAIDFSREKLAGAMSLPVLSLTACSFSLIVLLTHALVFFVPYLFWLWLGPNGKWSILFSLVLVQLIRGIRGFRRSRKRDVARRVGKVTAMFNGTLGAIRIVFLPVLLNCAIELVLMCAAFLISWLQADPYEPEAG